MRIITPWRMWCSSRLLQELGLSGGGGVGKKPLIPSITQVAPLWSAMHIRHMVLNQEWFCLPGGHLASFRDSSECYKWASTDI